MRISYNKILLNKYKVMKKKPLFAKNPRIHQLFNEFAIEITKDEREKRLKMWEPTSLQPQPVHSSRETLTAEEEFMRKVDYTNSSKRKIRQRNSQA